MQAERKKRQKFRKCGTIRENSRVQVCPGRESGSQIWLSKHELYLPESN